MNNDINNDINNDDTIEDLDSTWLQEFENLNNDYKNYYTEELSFIRVHSVYVNNLNDINKIREERFILKTPGILQRDELLSIIKHNSYSNEIKYTLLSLLKFNINIDPINLKTFLRSKDKNIGSSFLHSIKNIDSIKFDKSISMFQDINDLIIIFHEKTNKNPVCSSQSNGSNNRTKKVFINSNTKKKTKTKRT